MQLQHNTETAKSQTPLFHPKRRLILCILGGDTEGLLCFTNGALCDNNGALGDTNTALGPPGDTAVTGNGIRGSGAPSGGTGK